MAGLTTHVLDTSIGRPASGVEIELHQLGADGVRTLIKRAKTNADGRTDAPLLAAAEARAKRRLGGGEDDLAAIRLLKRKLAGGARITLARGLRRC